MKATYVTLHNEAVQTSCTDLLPLNAFEVKEVDIISDFNTIPRNHHAQCHLVTQLSLLLHHLLALSVGTSQFSSEVCTARPATLHSARCCSEMKPAFSNLSCPLLSFPQDAAVVLHHCCPHCCRTLHPSSCTGRKITRWRYSVNTMLSSQRDRAASFKVQNTWKSVTANWASLPGAFPSTFFIRTTFLLCQLLQQFFHLLSPGQETPASYL